MLFSFLSAHRRSHHSLCLVQAQSLNSVLPFLQRFPHVTSVFRHVCPRICGFVLLLLRVMPRRKWGFDEGSLPSVVAAVVARSRPPSVQWPHSQRNTSAVDHQVPAAKKGKGKGFGPAKGKGSHQQAPRHNATGQSVAVPKKRVPMSPDQVVEAARSRVAKLKQLLTTLGEEDDMCPAVQEALSKAECQA